MREGISEVNLSLKSLFQIKNAVIRFAHLFISSNLQKI